MIKKFSRHKMMLKAGAAKISSAVKTPGWKTYTACGALVVLGFVSYLTGHNPPDAIVSMLVGFGGIAARIGAPIARDGAKIAALIIQMYQDLNKLTPQEVNVTNHVVSDTGALKALTDEDVKNANSVDDLVAILKDKAVEL